jgi:hypothetical protein
MPVAAADSSQELGPILRALDRAGIEYLVLLNHLASVRVHVNAHLEARRAASRTPGASALVLTSSQLRGWLIHHRVAEPEVDRLVRRLFPEESKD